MGATKEWAIWLRGEMPEEVYTQIPEHLKDDIKIKVIDIPDAKKLYRKDEEWNELNKQVKKALDLRAEREAKIRIENG
jgi:hypothetical protein